MLEYLREEVGVGDVGADDVPAAADTELRESPAEGVGVKARVLVRVSAWDGRVRAQLSQGFWRRLVL